MKNFAKPRLAEVLGVEVGERFKVSDSDGGWDGDVVFHINEYGKFISGKDPGSSIALCCAIQHPESIIRAPHLTEPELAICKAVGAKWVSMNAIGIGKSRVTLWDDKPMFDGSMFYITEDDESFIAVSTIGRINQNLFPSVHPGDLIPVDLGK